MTDRPTIIEAMRDPTLFNCGPLDTHEAWIAILKGLYGLAMDAAEVEIFSALTGGRTPPAEESDEFAALVGRRAGKTEKMALLGSYEAVFGGHEASLSRGERGYVLLVAADRPQAQLLKSYISALIGESSKLKHLIERETATQIDLTNEISLQVVTSNYRTIRGRAICVAILDELCFWRHERANCDVEILNAIRPGMAAFPRSKLFMASSPWTRSGVLYQVHRRHYGKPGKVLVVQAETRDLNPTIRQDVIDRAYDEDATVAATEFGAQFRSDLQALLDQGSIDQAVDPDRPLEIPHDAAINYAAFVDVSGGRSDAAALGIAHREGEAAVLDLLHVQPAPHDPMAVIADFAATIKRYGLHEVSGDAYAAEFVTQGFAREGVSYLKSEKTRSAIYLEAAPLFHSGRVSLPRTDRLLTELAGLERRAGRQGRDQVDHGPGGHDDAANAALGAIVLATSGPVPISWQEFEAGCELYGSNLFDDPHGYGGGYLNDDPTVGPWLADRDF